MNTNIAKNVSLGMLIGIFFFTANVSAHEGHDHAPGEEAQDTSGVVIAITPEAKKNLQLIVDEAQVRSIDKTLMVIGQIEAIPNRSATVASRISGRVLLVQVSDGEKVRKGQPLVEIESRQLGNPPPRVQYTALIDGIVTDRHVVTGDNVEPDKHLLEIVSLEEVYAEGRIYEGQIAFVKTGHPVRVVVESFPQEIFTGRIELLSGALDPETRTLSAWARLKNPELKLRPNMRATLYIVTSQVDSAIAVPLSALLGEAGNYFVFVQSDTDELEFERRSVVMGIKDDRYIEIIEGVLPGEKVVTTGNYQLQYVPKKKIEEKQSSQAEKKDNH